jgi:hypothetical protein
MQRLTNRRGPLEIHQTLTRPSQELLTVFQETNARLLLVSEL